MLPNTKDILGWDIGGANVKIALHREKQIINVQQLACSLWKGVHELRKCMHTILSASDYSNTLHVITMTGELVDLFYDRKHGVESIINEVASNIPQERTLFYAGESGFIKFKHAMKKHDQFAEAI